MTRRRRKRQTQIRYGTIHVTDGRFAADPEARRILADHGLRPDSVFSGAWMQCLICGRVQRSDPDTESDWRAITADDGRTRYFCPAEFPPDDIRTADLFKMAYMRCILALQSISHGKPLTAEIFRPIDWNKP